MITFDGDNKSDIKLWHTYMYWARKNALFQQKVNLSSSKVIVDDPSNRVEEEISAAIQTILFSCFTLEYRLKRVLIALNVFFPPKETFGPFLDNFWKRLINTSKLKLAGFCRPPSEWSSIEPDLKSLIKLRNNIAHANYNETIQFIAGTSDPMTEARRFYNVVVDAIRLVNQGTGYDPRPPDELEKYFQPLKV